MGHIYSKDIESDTQMTEVRKMSLRLNECEFWHATRDLILILPLLLVSHICNMVVFVVLVNNLLIYLEPVFPHL